MHAQTLKRTSLLKLARDGHVGAELRRREEQRWCEADDGGVTLLSGLVKRLVEDFERPRLVVAGGIEYDNGEALEEVIATLNRLIEKTEVLAQRGADEIAGFEHKSLAVSMVRPQHKEAR